MDYATSQAIRDAEKRIDDVTEDATRDALKAVLKAVETAADSGRRGTATGAY